MENHKKILFQSITSLTLFGSFIALPVSALTLDTGATTNVGVSAGASSATVKTEVQAGKISLFISKADQEITRRIEALNQLNTRTQAMQRVSDQGKAQIKAQLEGNIKNLTDLKAKIDAETDIATLKTDVKSITDSYRIFVLVLPQGRILAAGDKIVSISTLMQNMAAKFQARMQIAQTAGKDVTALQKALVDMQAKITDAQSQAQAGVNVIAALAPDQGDKAKMQSNTASLNDARTKIRAGITDIQAARKDIASIISGLKAMHLDAKTSASASSTTSVGQ